MTAVRGSLPVLGMRRLWHANVKNYVVFLHRVDKLMSVVVSVTACLDGWFTGCVGECFIQAMRAIHPHALHMHASILYLGNGLTHFAKIRRVVENPQPCFLQ